MADSSDIQQIEELVDELQGTSRRRRQEIAHTLSLVAKANPELLLEHKKKLIKALNVNEAQTRWEILDALSELAIEHASELSSAVSGAETSLFDDLSATVRLSAFIFLCRYGASTPKRAEDVWPILDEALQCYHGDAEYRDMLTSLMYFAQGKASKEIKKLLCDRISFDAENASGYIKTFSAEIVKAVS